MRIVIANTQLPFVRGGAELLAEGLVQALRASGHRVEIALLPFTHRCENYLSEITAARLYDFQASCDLLIGLKFPAYLCRHPNKVLWLLHQDRDSYDLWGSPFASLACCPEGPSIRQVVREIDEVCLPEFRKRLTISNTVSRRLRSYLDLESDFLYPPVPGADLFYCERAEPYLFFPSRLAPNKRHELALEALSRAPKSVRMIISGSSEGGYESVLKDRARTLGLTDRVDFRGHISETEKLKLYARCQAVVFPSYDEDFGYVTAEAMLARKPVITCCDSGGAAELVVHDETGIVCEPHPDALADAYNLLMTKAELARDFGQAGRLRYQTIIPSWEEIVTCLLERTA